MQAIVAATAQEEPGLRAALPGAPRGEALRAALGVLAPQALRGGAPTCTKPNQRQEGS